MRRQKTPTVITAALQAATAEAEPEKPISFRDFLFSDDFAGPYMKGTGVSPTIEAIALASEGLPIPETLLSDKQVQDIFRCDRSALVGIKPRDVGVGAGRQSGKTANLLAPKCVHAAWTTPIPNLKPGQIAQAIIISPKTKQSQACFNYCKGIIESSPILKEAAKIQKTAIVLTRPDGTKVEIVVGAAARGGGSGRSGTIIFAGLDEASFFYPDGSAGSNDRDIYDAVFGSVGLIDGAQIWIVSTPWIAGMGILEERIRDYWGKPGAALVVARVSTYTLRGITDDGSLRGAWDEDTYNREYLANPLPAGSTGFFSIARVLEAEARILPPGSSITEHGAGADLGFLNDSSALVIASQRKGGLFSVDSLVEMSPKQGQPLKPTVVVNSFAATLKANGIQSVASDIHEKATAIEIFGNHRISVADAPTHKDEKEKTYRAVKTLLEEGRLSLANLGEAEREKLRDQLRMIVAKPRLGGGYEISAPRQATRQSLAAEGKSIKGHADSVSALVLALWRAGSTNAGLWKEKPTIWQPKRGSSSPSTSRKPNPRDEWSSRTGGRDEWR